MVSGKFFCVKEQTANSVFTVWRVDLSTTFDVAAEFNAKWDGMRPVLALPNGGGLPRKWDV